MWRRKDPLTGKRTKRSTGVRDLQKALRKAAQFEEEWEQRRAGLRTYDCWRTKLGPLVPQWIESLDASEKTKVQYEKELLRALEQLGLRVAADLDDVALLDAKLRALDVPQGTKRRCFQDTLRRFVAFLAENKRVLDRNPLLSWGLLKVESPESRKAMMPDDMARAFLALDVLDKIKARKNPQRIVFTALLVSPQRSGAFVSRDVEHFLGDRIDFGKGKKKKRRGAGALDSKTAEELQIYVGDREEGPLFLSPRGGRWGQPRFLVAWKEAYGLGVVSSLWPSEEPWDVNVAHFVTQALLTGKAAVNKGGNPQRIHADTVDARKETEQRVLALAERLRPEWEHAMQGVVVHAFRNTHRTWADAAGVHPRTIDRQLGHSAEGSTKGDELAKYLAGSKTGRRHYLDKDSALFNPTRSAEAVRAMLDAALAQVSLVPKMVPMGSKASLANQKKKA